MTESARDPDHEDRFDAFLEAWASGVDSADSDWATDDDPDLAARVSLIRELSGLHEMLAEEPADDGTFTPLDRLGRYENLQPLGEGGLSQVYSAHDSQLGRDVALKVLDPRGFDVDRAREWMLSEGRALAKVEHPGVVRLHEVGEEDGTGFVVMELVHGVTLHEVVQGLRAEDESELSAEVALAVLRLRPIQARLRLIAELAHALHACHAEQVLHRDIKPANILVNAKGEPRLIDFGLAHLEGSESIGLTQQMIGTPGYVAPEQVDGKRTGTDPRSDQFSLGVVMYELLTGVNPFLRETREETLDAISRCDPPSMAGAQHAIPSDVDRICLHALERRPQDRFVDLAALASDVEAFLEFRAIAIGAPSFMRILGRLARRHRRNLIISLVALIIFATISVTTTILGHSADLRELEEDIALETAQLTKWTTPMELGMAVEQFGSLKARANALVGMALLFGESDVLMDLSKLSIDLTARFEERMMEDWQSVESSQYTDSRDSRFTTTFRLWSGPLVSLNQHIGTTKVTERYYLAGTLDIDSNATMHRIMTTPETRFYSKPEDPRALGYGRIRILLESEDGLRETEIDSIPWLPRRRVDLNKFDGSLRQGSIELDRCLLEIPDQPGNQYSQPRAWIGREPIKWAQFFSQFQDGDLGELAPSLVADRYFEGRSDDDYAIVPWFLADEFLRRAGARFPTEVELWLASSDPTFVPGRGTGNSARVEAEMLTSWASPGNPEQRTVARTEKFRRKGQSLDWEILFGLRFETKEMYPRDVSNPWAPFRAAHSIEANLPGSKF